MKAKNFFATKSLLTSEELEVALESAKANTSSRMTEAEKRYHAVENAILEKYLKEKIEIGSRYGTPCLTAKEYQERFNDLDTRYGF